MISLPDQLGLSIDLPSVARRIVSVVPSQTELLYSLGLDAETLGITRFCIHPKDWFNRKTRVGGTKDLRIAHIRELNPDLVLANKEENDPGQIDAIRAFCPVWTSDISGLDQAYAMMHSVGRMTGRSEESDRLISEIRNAFHGLAAYRPYSALYLIWREPYMAAGGDSFISQMMAAAGYDNVLQQRLRYPTLSTDDIRALAPQVLLLSSEPYPFRDKHIGELQDILPETRIILVDGEMFSWYGSRMQRAPAYFHHLRTRYP